MDVLQALSASAAPFGLKLSCMGTKTKLQTLGSGRAPCSCGVYVDVESDEIRSFESVEEFLKQTSDGYCNLIHDLLFLPISTIESIVS